MKLDLNKAVKTRDGCKARIICTDLQSTDGSIVAAVSGLSGQEILRTYYKDGYYLPATSPIRCHDYDLLNVPEEKEAWVVICENTDGHLWGSVHRKRSGADEAAYSKGTNVKTQIVHLTWEASP